MILDTRDYLLLAAILVALYLLVQVFRLRKSVARRSAGDRTPPPTRSRTEPVSVGEEISDEDFANQLAKSSMSLDLAQLRRETVALRSDIARLGEEVEQLKATQNVSPVYSEAMRMAERGELPAGISARCGISLGEAELVAAMARREFRAADRAEREDSYREPRI